MPNHVHGILVIDKTMDELNEMNTMKDDFSVETRLIASLQSPPPTDNPQKPIGGFAGNKNPMLNDNLSRIVRWFKGRTSFESRKIHADFSWQSHFYDHIIRNEQSYQIIVAYIINNPVNWKDDKFYTT